MSEHIDTIRLRKWYSNRNCLHEHGIDVSGPVRFSDLVAALDRLPDTPPEVMRASAEVTDAERRERERTWFSTIQQCPDCEMFGGDHDTECLRR